MRAIFLVLIFGLVLGCVFAEESKSDSVEPDGNEDPKVSTSFSFGNEDQDYHKIHDDMTEEELKELDNIDISELVQLCKDLKQKYGPFLTWRFQNHPEQRIMSKAGIIGKHLHKARFDHLKKDHEHWSCEEAKEVLEHSDAKQFVDYYHEFVQNANGKNIDQSIELLEQLRIDLLKSGLVSQHSIDEVDDAISDLQHLKKWYGPLKKNYDRVLSGKDCTGAYQEFMKELEDIVHDKAPQWEDLHRGIESLNRQCAEDEEIKGEL
jgi:hypothetical protein